MTNSAPAPVDVSAWQSVAEKARAWPFAEARALLKRLERAPKTDGPVVFETGYGPSGLPHIGTFGEVARTTMVRNAFRALTGDKVPTALYCVSDDMDGLRKVPDNVPSPEILTEDLGKPLTAVRDPFGTHDSFGAHNNARLQAFLDSFGFDYTFVSATEMYKTGRYDEVLLRVLERFEDVQAVMLPTLGEERRASYSPFLPLCPKTGRVLQVPTLERNVDKGTIVFADEDGDKHEVPVTGGHVKLQWKPDWAMRWVALGVDYEMSGKDLIDSVKASGKICRALGGTPPAGFNYELFLDENGEKISKSKGNGISIEDWLKFGTPESLSLFMFQSPKSAKRLYFDVIPKLTDDYLNHLDAYGRLDEAKQIDSPAWHIHASQPPAQGSPISFNLLINLVSAANVEDEDTLWGYIARYAPGTTRDSHPILEALVERALVYYKTFVAPHKQRRAPTPEEAKALADLKSRLEAYDGDPTDAEALQTLVFDVGKAAEYENLRAWFQALYEILLGASQGPRFGSFIALYGLSGVVALIDSSLVPQPAS